MQNNQKSKTGMVTALGTNLALSFLAPGGLIYLVSMINGL